MKLQVSSCSPVLQQSLLWHLPGVDLVFQSSFVHLLIEILPDGRAVPSAVLRLLIQLFIHIRKDLWAFMLCCGLSSTLPGYFLGQIVAALAKGAPSGWPLCSFNKCHVF